MQPPRITSHSLRCRPDQRGGGLGAGGDRCHIVSDVPFR